LRQPYAVADLIPGNANPEFMNNADGLMANDPPRLDGVLSFQNVNICAADGGQGYADDGFAAAARA
jgi:hypothetical protein